MLLSINPASISLRFLLFRRSSKTEDFSKIVEKLEDSPVDFNRIRCPLCRWQPKASSRWCCGDSFSHQGCGTVWNTFETRGQCPGCQYQWKWTDCLRCSRSSPHEAWYETEDT